MINRFTLRIKSNLTIKFLISTAILTTIIAGLTAMKEKDIKKIVAISTLSQLGIIMITSAIIIRTLAILHTNTHALFKALLFITVGRMIEKKEGTQKKKKLERAESKRSMTRIKTATITLIRLPITSRFFSKDIIIETIIQKNKTGHSLIIVITAVLTTAYSLLIINEMAKKKKSSEGKEAKAKKGETLIVVTMVTSRTIMSSTTETMITQTRQTEKIT